MTKHYLNCRLCNSPDILDVLDFGETAPANAYINPSNPILNEEYPLRVFLCLKCSSVQLRDTVDPEKLFKNYKYASSTIPSLVKHFSGLAFDIRKILPQGSLLKVMEIGSNDGVLLRQFKALGFNVLGVEPSENLAKAANDEGLTTECSFFNESRANYISEKYGKFDVISSNNCFAHIDDIKSVVKGIKKCLSSKGIFVFENAYLLDTIKGLYFDQCLTPGQNILTSRGLIKIEDVTMDDKVLTHLGNLKKITHLFKNEYDGDVIDIYSYGNSKPLSLTPEHPVYVLRDGKKQFIESKNIKKGDKLLKSSIKYIEETQALKLSHRQGNNHKLNEYSFEINENLCKIFGYFLAEGYYYECKQGSAQAEFAFGKSQSEKELAEDCSRCLISHGAKGNVVLTEYGWHVITYGAMARLLKREFNSGAINKNIPGWVFSLPNNLCQTFLESYMKGDGYIYRDAGYLRGTTISENLAQGISFLANKIGYSCSINIGKALTPRRIANNKNISILKYNPIDILVRRRQVKKNKTYCDGDYQYNLVKNVSIRKYKGLVYNLEVNKDNSYTTTQSSVHNCYSEHIFYHSIKPLKQFFDNFDLEIFKVEHVNIQGGSIRVFVKNLGDNTWKIDKSVDEFIKKEDEAGLSHSTLYKAFNEQISKVKSELNGFIAKEVAKGKTFSAYGAAAKFTTFCSVLGFEKQIKYVVDDSPLKWGLLTPQSLTPIIKPNEFYANPTDYCIITAWNFADAIVKNNKEYTNKGGKFIKPLPSLEII